MQQHLVQPLADTKADDAADDVAGRWAYLITTDDDPKGLNQLLHSSHRDAMYTTLCPRPATETVSMDDTVSMETGDIWASRGI